MTHLLDGVTPHRGDLYHEFTETWETPVAEGVKPRRVSQRATGRTFAYVRRVTHEAIEDGNRPCDGELDVLDHHDFTYLRMRQV